MLKLLKILRITTYIQLLLCTAAALVAYLAEEFKTSLGLSIMAFVLLLLYSHIDEIVVFIETMAPKSKE